MSKTFKKQEKDDDEVEFTLKEFISEHKKLSKLDKMSKQELKSEAREQSSELKKVLKENRKK